MSNSFLVLVYTCACSILLLVQHKVVGILDRIEQLHINENHATLILIVWEVNNLTSFTHKGKIIIDFTKQ